MMLTIFTPTYNREKELYRLYNSLVKQNNKNFVWLIIDDGSIDNTENLVNQLINNKNNFKIIYKKQKNQGKHIAYNTAIDIINTELFICVDSDDYLLDDAIDKIFEFSKELNNDNINGLLFYRIRENGELITKYNNKISIATLNDLYRRYKLKGDTELVFKSDIIKKYKFPEFSNEKFCPEAYIYDKLDEIGKLYVTRIPLCICEYLDDGMTKNIKKLIFDNKKGYEAFIINRLNNDKLLSHIILDTIRYVAIKITLKNYRIFKDTKYKLFVIFLYIFGFLFYKKEYSKYE